MDFLGIEAFLAIVKTGSLSKAAELLHLSQSAVSHRLKVLERDIGVMLIQRHKGIQTIQLTPFGESFVGLAERWTTLHREMNILRESGPHMTLAIGAANSLNVYVLPPLYRALNQQSPVIRLQIRSQTTVDSYRSIECRERDIAFVKMERVEPNIIVEPFFEDEMILVQISTGERLGETIVSPLELDCRYEIYMNWGPAYQIWHDRWWDAYSTSSIQVDTAALIFSLMSEPRQWAVVPRSIAKAFEHVGNFSFKRLSDPPPSRRCYKIMHKYPTSDKAAALNILNQYVELIYGNRGKLLI